VFGIGVGTVIRYGSYRKWVFAAEPKAAEAEPSGAVRLPVDDRASLRASDAA
jgi:hypothetical protein